MSGKDIKCCVCQKQFSAVFKLAKHARKYHPEQAADIIPKKSYKYQCLQCNKNFSLLKNFNYHKKTHNQSHNPPSKNTYDAVCPICQLKAPKDNLILHFKVEHDIKCETLAIEFTTFEEFSKWKSDMEHDTKSKYVAERGSQRGKDGTTIIKYCCHRSGKYVASGKGLRHLKTQGSNKIDGFCPARLKVIIDKNNQCKVSFIKQHVGHDEGDLRHLFLTLQERKCLANKMALKIPFPQILDEIRDSVVGSQLDRIHLLTRKDLSNIERSFHLQSSVVRHESDAVSVDAWVKQRESSGSILFYKPQGTQSESNSDLREEDFVLIIMNQGQEEILKKYGSDCICIDSTHGLNQYDFEMHTLLVIDDVREGFPCAFLISNRSDETVIKIFFHHIKERIGFQVTSKVFMSDMAEAYYKAWNFIMGPAKYRLFCTWHVDRSWRKNLSKIKTKEKQVMVYKYLRTLLEERDENAFLRMLNDFIRTITNDPETNEFSEYFKNNYINNRHCWAYCYRLHSGLNTNMHIERMHRTIKCIYFGGRKVKRLDKALDEIEKFIRDRLFNRRTVLFKDERNLLISEDPKASEVSGIVTGLTVNEALNPKEFDKQFIAKERQRLIETFIQLLEGATCMEQLEAAKNMCIALETTLPFNSNEKGANNTVYTCKS
nr:PREDICTED: uncharacterized protein LOC103312776 [Tribolium castaneum]|eukprot:XP_008192473.1 PREDICTED: uncharacterized protein LOC103312776 [Tribolium castaneum]